MLRGEARKKAIPADGRAFNPMGMHLWICEATMLSKATVYNKEKLLRGSLEEPERNLIVYKLKKHGPKSS